jgi:polyisoprenoid-binding protein YceI
MTPITATQPFTGTYVSDPVHSSFGFAVKHIVSTFRASFGDVEATLTSTDEGLVLEGKAKAESISVTAPEQFRGHLLSADFFDAENYPTIDYRSTSITLGDDNAATVEGQLTIKGNTVNVVATGTYTEPVEGLMGEQRGALELEATVNKNDLGLTWNAPLPKGGNVLSDDVKLNIHVELTAQA